MNLGRILMVAAHEAAAPPAGIPGAPTDVELYIYAGSKYGIQWVNSTDLPGTCQTEIDTDGDTTADQTVSTAVTQKDLGTTSLSEAQQAQVRHVNVNGESAWVGPSPA